MNVSMAIMHLAFWRRANVLVKFSQKFCLSRICRGRMGKNECQAGVEGIRSDSKVVHVRDNVATSYDKYQLKLNLDADSETILTLKCIANIMSSYNTDRGVPVLRALEQMRAIASRTNLATAMTSRDRGFEGENPSYEMPRVTVPLFQGLCLANSCI
jgi:hypothetical protein